MLAIVGGTLRYEQGCFFVGGDDREGPRRLVIWPMGVTAGEDESGPYVDIRTTRLRPGDIFTSGGGEVGVGKLDVPQDCRTEKVVIAYSPRRADPPGEPYPEPPPPPRPPAPTE